MSAKAIKHELPQFEAALTVKEVEEFEADQNTTLGVKRRMMLATLSRSSEQLIDSFGSSIPDDDGDVLIGLIDQITEYKDHLMAMRELADSALARLFLVGQYVSQGLEK